MKKTKQRRHKGEDSTLTKLLGTFSSLYEVCSEHHLFIESCNRNQY